MKVLLYSLKAFSLTHGGLQIQILQTHDALSRLGVETEFLRWWDGNQAGDVLHFFGRMPTPLLQQAQRKGMKVVVTDLLTEQGSRSGWHLRLHRAAISAMTLALPSVFTEAYYWDSYRLADACVALTSWEARLVHLLFGAPCAKTHVVPNGVEEAFLNSAPSQRGPWLVCAATITERKRVLELAEAAVRAETPLWIVGSPYSEKDAYFKRFQRLIQQNASLLRYEGAISDRAKLAEVYRAARGFVLLSAMESLSLSALEAAACGCPVLLSKLPWARTVFGPSASYCPVTSSLCRTAEVLRSFYATAPNLAPPAKPQGWLEVARQLKCLYESLLNNSHEMPRAGL